MNKKQAAALMTAAIISVMMASCLMVLSTPISKEKGAQLVSR